MKPLKIGHVDLDTSHPGSWIPILRAMGHEIAGVYDSGAIYPAGYANEFAKKHEIANVYSSLEEMAENVDVAIVHSCNWDVHIERAEPFIRAGKAVLVDKPMVGNMKDAIKLMEWARRGYRITGGSSLRYAPEVQHLRDKAKEEFGDIQFIYAGCAVDHFNYGIHAYSMLHGLMGNGIESVRHLGVKDQHLIEINWKDGRKGILSIGGTEGHHPFYATITGTRQVCHIQVDSSRIYRALLESTLPYLGGEAENPPVGMEQLLEVEMAALAAKVSWENNNRLVFLNDLSLDDPGYDGGSFAEHYRLLKIN